MIEEGIRDLARGRETVPSLLVAIGYPRLRSLHRVFANLSVPDDSNRRLYRLLLSEEGAEAYPKYNSLIRRLVSFERALEHRVQARSKMARNVKTAPR